MSHEQAVSVWDRQLRKGGEQTGNVMNDAMARVRQLRHEREQAAQGAAAAAAPPVGGGLASGGLRTEEYRWMVLPDRHGQRQVGGPGTDLPLDKGMGEKIHLFVPPTATPGRVVIVRVERNLDTGQLTELSNSINGVQLRDHSGRPVVISGPWRGRW